MVSEIQNTVVDPNWIMAIIALCAIISPIITTIINNIFQARNKRMENYELAKRNALEQYINALYSKNYSKNCDNPEELYKALNKLYLYFPSLSDDDYSILEDSYGNPYTRSDNSHKTIQNLSKQIKKN